MNHLLKISFDRCGYDYDFLKNIYMNKYDGKYLFRDEDKLMLKLKYIRDTKQKIVILPDFDMDGISSGLILYAGLSLFGFNTALYAPDVTKGYGFDEADIDNIIFEHPDVRYIITCDVGITCYHAVTYAKSKGIEMLITDHHPEAVNNRVDADIIVDPSRYDSDCDFIGVCGAYVAYHVVSTFSRMLDNKAIIDLVRHLELFAALGSCGDLMPVIHDTRSIIINGIKEFNALLDADDLNSYFQCSVDLLPDVFVSVFENIRRLHFWLLRNNNMHVGDITDVDFGFTYCPMFNSVKRMQGDIKELYKLLYTRYEWNDESFDALAGWLWNLNLSRKALVSDTFSDLIDNIDNQKYAPYIFVTTCSAGICGLLAMKVMQYTGTICLMVTDCDDMYIGSGRIPEWFDRNILQYESVKIDGHANAFGIRIPKNICDDYFKYLDKVIAEYVSELQDQAVEDNRIILAMGGHMCYDNKYDLSITRPDDYDMCFGYACEIEKFRPFGKGFIEPEHIFKITKKDILDLRLMGSAKTHFKITVPFNINMVCFGGASRYFDIIDNCFDDDQVFAFSGRFSINEFNNNKNLHFVISEMLS